LTLRSWSIQQGDQMMIRRPIGAISAAAPLALLGAVAFSAPAYADGTAECNVNAGPNGIPGDGDDPAGATECGVNSVADEVNATAVGNDAQATAEAATAVGQSAFANSLNSSAVGRNSTAQATDASAFGALSFADGIASTATGSFSDALGDFSTATGSSSLADGLLSTATGYNTQANGTYSTANGADAIAQGDRSTATGGRAEAIGEASTATGHMAFATGTAATATGQNTRAVGTFSTATGQGAVASANFSTATGASARAEGVGSVALGAGAIATQDNTVSLGNGGAAGAIGGATRRIVNMSDGIAATDGATVGQMNAANLLQDNRLSAAELLNSQQNTRIGNLETLVTALGNDSVETRRQANGGIATAMAMGGMMVVPDSNVSVNLNLSTYRGQQGFAGGVVARVGRRTYVNAGVAGSTVRGSTGGRVGIAFGF
jgi:trimeric autotransporter adhesin